MKKIRVFSLIAAVLMSGIMLVGCGKAYDPIEDTNTYAGLSAIEVYTFVRENIAESIITMEDAHIDEIMTNSSDIISSGVLSPDIVNCVKNWKEMKPEVGDFIAYGDYVIASGEEVISVTQTIEFANRDAIFTFLINDETSAIESITFEKIPSLGEKMTKAGQNTLMGIGTVFIMLVVMSLIISAFQIIPYITKKIEEKKADSEVVEPAEDSEFVKQVAQREELANDSLELVAVIAAAIAASTGTTTDDFVVRSIKRRI